MKPATPLKYRRLTDPRQLSVHEVANHLRIHPKYYTEIENGTRLPSLRLLIQIAHFWGMSLDDIVSGFTASLPAPDVSGATAPPCAPAPATSS